jgi:hypothetical protein
MPSLLTEIQLQENIISLKDSLDEFDHASGRKLFFFSSFCFYDHFCRFPSVNGLLDRVEPYIPLSLGAESMEMFIHAAGQESEMETYADYFMLKARVDFVESLQNANTPERWARLLSICGAIRDIKEQLLLLAAP